MNLRELLERRLAGAMALAGAPSDCPAVVSPSARKDFGDYQASGAMAAAKRLKTNPRQLAQRIADAALQDDAIRNLAEKIEVAGPGFINIHLNADFLARQLAAMASDDRLGMAAPTDPQTVVVDYSAPNLAKEMHVGHLRSTIIGDALVRVLEFLGHKVIRQNHVGDWGTQYGMLLAHLQDLRIEHRGATASELPELRDLEVFYKEAKTKFDADPEFAKIARQRVVSLQRGEGSSSGAWNEFRRISLDHCQRVYEKLGVRLREPSVRGESFYGGVSRGGVMGVGRNYLPEVVEHIRDVLPEDFRDSEGAQCVFLPEFTGKDNELLPFIVQKSDEGYLYATTDLAAVWFRCGKGKEEGIVDWRADRILYVVDARQSLHFKMLFAVARKAGFAPEGVSLEHVAFGTMMGPDGRPFKTRDGGTVKLMDLLDEAEKRAYELVTEKDPELPEEQRRDIAHAVGIGAVKYADLSQHRTSDYVFSFEKMLSLVGNTAPYMQYAYARIRSIFRKGAASDNGDLSASEFSPQGRLRVSASFSLLHPAERALAVKLLQFPETVQAVAEQCLPNILCNYLYELAGLFMGFYENCPVLQSEEPLRSSRLALCDLAARVVRTGLGLLGIGTIERM